MRCQFIPSYVLDRLAEAADEPLAECVRRTRAIDEVLRSSRAVTAPTATGADWEVHDADNGSTLPGRLVRTAGEPEVGDLAVDEAATGLTESLALFTDFGRDSYDDRGATVVATVHYEREYDNAFWDGTQLVFGDGDGRVFDRFTKPIDVLGHELAHAVTQFTADLTYEGQSGALNESMSDVFGACIKQRHLGQDAATADWLIGEGIFLPGINGRALRSMSDPGRRTTTRSSARTRRWDRWPTTWSPETTTVVCTSTAASPTVRSRSRRAPSAASRGGGLDGSGTPRSPPGSTRTATSPLSLPRRSRQPVSTPRLSRTRGRWSACSAGQRPAPSYLLPRAGLPWRLPGAEGSPG